MDTNTDRIAILNHAWTQRISCFVLIAMLVFVSACESTRNQRRNNPQNANSQKLEEAAPEQKTLESVPPIDRKKLPLVQSPYWEMIRNGKLRIGLLASSPPYCYQRGSQQLGFDVELAEHLGRTLGVKVELKPMTLQQIFQQLNSSNPGIDLGIANLTKTAQRAARVNFSAPYLTISQAAIVEKRIVEGTRQGAEIERRIYDSYSDLANFPGLRIAVSAGTVPEIHAQSYFPDAKLIRYDNVSQCLNALANGDVQAVAHDSPALIQWLKNSDQAYRYKALLRPVTRDELCIAMRKGDLEFLRWLDVYIQEIKSRGLVRGWQQQYFQNRN